MPVGEDTHRRPEELGLAGHPAAEGAQQHRVVRSAAGPDQVAEQGPALRHRGGEGAQQVGEVGQLGRLVVPGQPVGLLEVLQQAGQALAALSPTTLVQVRPGAQVADRDAYELVLTPRTDATRVGSVRISVDAATKLPLAVRVYARGSSTPSVDVAYTSVRFTAPATTYFTFSPPAGATVRTLSLSGAMARLAGRTTHRVIGSGWTRIVEVDTGSAV